MERPTQPASRLETLRRALSEKPETFDDLEASMLFLDASFHDFRTAMITLGKMGKTFELILSMNNLGADEESKRAKLRQLKGIVDDSRLNKIITKITVKGRPGEQMIEPNVFSSGVNFIPIN